LYSKRHACSAKGAERTEHRPGIPLKVSRKIRLDHDQTLYRQRHIIENMFGRFKDWRCLATRYDRCAQTFFSRICIAAAPIDFDLNQWALSLNRVNKPQVVDLIVNN
jgi:transposase